MPCCIVITRTFHIALLMHACCRAHASPCHQENPKSYSTWHHRKWVVAQGLCSLERELALISK